MTMVNGFTNIVNGQMNVTQPNSSNTTTNLVNIQDIPLDKVRVGDIEMAVRCLVKVILCLHNGASDNMDAWDPSLLSRLASNHTVIIFDSRGIGNTTAGTEPYSYRVTW